MMRVALLDLLLKRDFLKYLKMLQNNTINYLMKGAYYVEC